jgi:hypothetical protein
MDPEHIRRRLDRAGIDRRPHYIAASKPLEQNPQWKGGKSFDRVDTHHQTRKLVENILGESLAQGWIIHHRDENSKHNEENNLILFPSAGCHLHYHQLLLESQRADPPVNTILPESESGGLSLPQYVFLQQWSRGIVPPDLLERIVSLRQDRIA